MKRILFAIIIACSVCCISSAKDNQQYPRITLTLNDSTIMHGYLRSNLHGAWKKISVSDTPDGKKRTVKMADISTLVVTSADEQSETFIPIYAWDEHSKKISKDPLLATVCFSGKHVVGYRVPSEYVKTSAAVPSSYFQTNTWRSKAWCYYYKNSQDSDIIKRFWVYIPAKKGPKLKSILKNVKKNFKEYPVVAETIEQRGLTAAEIIDEPCLLLEILDQNLD